MTSTTVQVERTGSTTAEVGFVTADDFAQQSVFPSRVTRSQMYYWSPRWQQDERESVEEIEAGHGVTFESGEALVAWLLEDDPADPSDED